MSVFMAILMGLLRGITQFLPISGSGHQAIIENIFGLEYPAKNGLFELLMNIAALISVIMVYRREIGGMLSESADYLKGRTSDDPMSEGRLTPSLRMIYFIIIGTLPLLLAIPINDRLGVLMDKTVFVGIAMIVMGAILFFTDKLVKTGRKNEKTMKTKDALLIGISQALSAIPGLSRTGITVSVGMSLGLGKDFSVRFAIFLSLPSTLVAIIISFFASFRTAVDWSSFFAYLVGFVVSVLSGYVSILILRMAAAKRKLRNFAYYIWLLGIITVILSLTLQ
ncbi:MAG: undecaprenyl-diphosphate phosphatase [Clostridiales bacterium]|nr:undecaprenyl-diphosphate phosphatase [Clostridiales bacterium]